MTAFLKRVEHQDAEGSGVDRILDEAVGGSGLGEHLQEAGAQIVVADAQVDGEGAFAQRPPQVAIGADVAQVGQVAAHQQQVRGGVERQQGAQGPVQATAVELERIAGLEAEVDVRDLGNQHDAPWPRNTAIFPAPD